MSFLTPSFFAPLPILWFGYKADCLGCQMVKPAVDRLERELRGRIIVRRVNSSTEAASYPVPLLEVPAFALQVDGAERLWLFDHAAVEGELDEFVLQDWMDEGLRALGWRAR